MSAGLQGLIDFVGYPVGLGAGGVAPDWNGAGFRGILDFTGVPVGRGPGVAGGHGPKIGPDRSLASMIVGDLMARRRTQRQYAAEAQVTLAAAKVRVGSVLNEANQRQAAHDRCMALILAEV